MGIWNPQHLSNIGDGFIMNLVIVLTPVAHLDEGHACAPIVHKLLLRLLQYL
jgi:hypothetical protein